MARTPSSVNLPATSAPVKTFKDSGSKNAQAMAIVSQLDADSDPLGDPSDSAWTGGPGGLIGILKAIALGVLPGVTLTDASVASAVGTSQTIAASSTTRNVLNVYNVSGASWWINESGGTAAIDTQGSFELKGGERWSPRRAPRNAVTAIGPVGSKLTVTLG